MPTPRLDHSKKRNGRRKRGVAAIIGMIFFILIVLIVVSGFLVVFNSFSSYTSTLKQMNQVNLQQKDTQLSVPGLSFGSQIQYFSPNVPTGIVDYVPIMLTNSQSTAVSGGTQVMLDINWNSYSSYLDNPVDNVLFFDYSGNNLNAWMENGTANTATNSAVWVKLNSTGIPASGSITIYMGFYALGNNHLNPLGPFGEAPQLSSTYAQYDDGASVFSAYFNGNTATPSFSTYSGYSVTQATGITYGSSKINAIKLTGYNGANPGLVLSSSSLLNQLFVAESNFQSPNSQSPGTDTGVIGFVDNSVASSVANAIGVNSGYGASYFNQDYMSGGAFTADQNRQGSANSQWLYGSITYSGPSSTSYSGYIAPRLYSTNGGYSGTLTQNPLTGATNIYLGFLSDTNNNYPVAIYFNWARARIAPPNNVMPSATFGSVTQTGYRNSMLTPSTIGTVSYQPVTTISSERKVVYAQNLWWAFYSTGSTTSGIVYQTSPDGLTWSATTQVTTTTGSQYGYDFSIWQNGNTIYYVLSTAAASAHFYWRYGTLNPSGTITWSVAQATAPTTYTTSSYCSIALDNFGNVWIALTTKQSSSNYHIEVWKYATSWSKVNDIGSLSSDETPILVPLTGGMGLVYGRGSTTSNVYVTTTTSGTSWSAPVSPTAFFALFDSSAAAIANSIYFGGLGSQSTGATSGTVDFWAFNSAQSTFSNQGTVDGNVSTWQVSISQSGNTLIAFYGSGSNVYQRYTLEQGYSWSRISIVSQVETNAVGISSAYSSSALIWTSGASTYNIRFAAYSIVSIENSSPFAIHVISLYIYDEDSGSLVHYDTNATASGVNGAFDFWLAEGETLNIPLAFSWTPGDTITATVSTDQGVLSSAVVNSPN